MTSTHEASSRARTHDISCTSYHIHDLESFGDVVTKAAIAAFPNNKRSRYRKVYVLLLSWEADELGVISEVQELDHVFSQIYLYQAEQWQIPSTNSHNMLAFRLMEFLRSYASNEHLLLIYYGGHGSMNDDRQCVWSCTEKIDSPTVQWYGLQTMLEQCESDTLILLDCCAAASSATASGNGVTELIAACGFETWAPGVGEHSFSRSLIEELKYLGRGPPFSVALLHNKVLSRIKYWKPRYTLPFTSERRKTPIYIQLANELNRRSIEISPLPQQEVVPSPGTSPQPAVDSTGQSSVSEDVDMLDSEPSQSSLAEVWPDPNFASPKVLISVALEDDQRLRPDDWNEWLRLIPALTKYMHIQGVYKSDSTVILGLVSVAIWDLLPEHLAISFVCFVRSNNLLSISPSYPEMSITAYDRNGYNTKVSNSTPSLVDKAVSPLKDINSSSQAHTSTHTPIFPEDKSEAQPGTLQGFLNKASYAPDRKPYRQAKVENFLHGQSDRVHWLPTSRKNKPNRSMFQKLSRMISTGTVKEHSALPSATSTTKEPQGRSYMKPNNSPLARLDYSAATGAAPDPAESKLTADGVPADDRRHGGEARRIAYPLKSSKGIPKHKDSSEERWDSNSSTAVGSVHGANRTNTTTTYKDHPEDRWEGSPTAISEKSFLPDVLPVTAKSWQERVGGHGDFQFPPTTHASYDPKARLWSRTTRGKPLQAYGDGSLHSLYRSALSPR